MSFLLLVDMVHPVVRNGSFGAGHRLIGGVRPRGGEVRTGKDRLVTIIEEPFLAGLETAYDGMPRRMKMSGRVAMGMCRNIPHDRIGRSGAGAPTSRLS